MLENEYIIISHLVNIYIYIYIYICIEIFVCTYVCMYKKPVDNLLFLFLIIIISYCEKIVYSTLQNIPIRLILILCKFHTLL